MCSLRVYFIKLRLVLSCRACSACSFAPSLARALSPSCTLAFCLCCICVTYVSYNGGCILTSVRICMGVCVRCVRCAPNSNEDNRRTHHRNVSHLGARIPAILAELYPTAVCVNTRTHTNTQSLSLSLSLSLSHTHTHTCVLGGRCSLMLDALAGWHCCTEIK